MSEVVTTSELDQILGDREILSVYQPIVELSTGQIVGYEALARGPRGSTLERPDLLFAEARRVGRLVELDLACRAAALRGALEANLHRDLNLFINIEPEVANASPTQELAELLEASRDALSVVVEVTERSLVTRPAELLGLLDEVRSLGWAIALDDVGADVASLALMPLVRPEVIKLDLRLVQQHPDTEIASIVGAVAAHAERTGALVLAEGIETVEHRDTGLALGAQLGQGWLWAKPGPLPATSSTHPSRPRVVGVATTAAHISTVEAARAPSVALRRSTKPLLLEMSWHLERQALLLDDHAVVVGAFQTAERFTPATAARYAKMAERAAFVGALGSGLTSDPAPGVRGGTIVEGDPLGDEWAIAVVGPHFAVALAAIDLHDTGPDRHRRFDYVITYDRDRAVAVARSLMARIVAQTV